MNASTPSTTGGLNKQYKEEQKVKTREFAICSGTWMTAIAVVMSFVIPSAALAISTVDVVGDTVLYIDGNTYYALTVSTPAGWRQLSSFESQLLPNVAETNIGEEIAVIMAPTSIIAFNASVNTWSTPKSATDASALSVGDTVGVALDPDANNAYAFSNSVNAWVPFDFPDTPNDLAARGDVAVARSNTTAGGFSDQTGVWASQAVTSPTAIAVSRQTGSVFSDANLYAYDAAGGSWSSLASSNISVSPGDRQIGFANSDPQIGAFSPASAPAFSVQSQPGDLAVLLGTDSRISLYRNDTDFFGYSSASDGFSSPETLPSATSVLAQTGKKVALLLADSQAYGLSDSLGGDFTDKSIDEMTDALIGDRTALVIDGLDAHAYSSRTGEWQTKTFDEDHPILYYDASGDVAVVVTDNSVSIFSALNSTWSDFAESGITLLDVGDDVAVMANENKAFAYSASRDVFVPWPVIGITEVKAEGNTCIAQALDQLAAFSRWTGAWGSTSLIDSGDQSFLAEIENLFAVHGSSSDNVFAVGAKGTILHYDGSAWTQIDSPTSVDLYGVWVYDTSFALAVGEGGTILSYNGSQWIQTLPIINTNLYGIWGSSDTNVYAVGQQGIVLHFDGTAWTVDTVASDLTPDDLNDIWGASSSFIFAVGNGGMILHYDGSDWSSRDDVTGADLYGVWGSGSTSGEVLFAVGAGGEAYGYDFGGNWTPIDWGLMDTPTSDLFDVWGVDTVASWSEDELGAFIVGEDGTILEYDGTTWKDESVGTGNLYGAWASDASFALAVGEGSLIPMRDGSGWGFEGVSLSEDIDVGDNLAIGWNATEARGFNAYVGVWSEETFPNAREARMGRSVGAIRSSASAAGFVVIGAPHPIELLSPLSRFVTTFSTPSAFAWDGGGFSDFDIVFATTPSPSADTSVTFGVSGSQTFSPNASQWQQILDVLAEAQSDSPVYWTVIGSDSRGNADFGDYFPLIITGMEPPVPTYPDGGVFGITEPPKFEWLAGDYSEFRVEVSTFSDFRASSSTYYLSPWLPDLLYQPLATEWEALADIAGSNTIYWRVVGRESGKPDRASDTVLTFSIAAPTSVCGGLSNPSKKSQHGGPAEMVVYLGTILSLYGASRLGRKLAFLSPV